MAEEQSFSEKFSKRFFDGDRYKTVANPGGELAKNMVWMGIVFVILVLVAIITAVWGSPLVLPWLYKGDNNIFKLQGKSGSDLISNVFSLGVFFVCVVIAIFFMICIIYHIMKFAKRNPVGATGFAATPPVQ